MVRSRRFMILLTIQEPQIPAAKEQPQSFEGKGFLNVDSYNVWKERGTEDYYPSNGNQPVVGNGTITPNTGVIATGNTYRDQATGKVYEQYAMPAINWSDIPTSAATQYENPRFYIGTKEYKNQQDWENALTVENIADAFITDTNKAVESDDDEEIGKPIWNDDEVVAYGHYTGNIDKDWSINLIEASGNKTSVIELIDHAELYKATAADYHSYKDVTDEIQPNAVYLKVVLKDEWKTVDEETLKYYVYIADNSNKNNKTNEVWVSGTYANNDWEYVDFTWTNNAAEAQLWKVKKGENGTAVFDFADKAFFTVKMYSGESMYLDLSTAYDKAIAGEMDAEADSFYKFDNDNANFSRTGELIIVTDDSSLVHTKSTL